MTKVDFEFSTPEDAEKGLKTLRDMKKNFDTARMIKQREKDYAAPLGEEHKEELKRVKKLLKEADAMAWGAPYEYVDAMCWSHLCQERYFRDILIPNRLVTQAFVNDICKIRPLDGKGYTQIYSGGGIKAGFHSVYQHKALTEHTVGWGYSYHGYKSVLVEAE